MSWVILILGFNSLLMANLVGFKEIDGSAQLICASIFTATWFICTRLDAILAALKGDGK